MTRRYGYAKLDKPPGYYRSGLSVGDIREAMLGAEWMTVTQITGMVAHKLTPEARARFAEMHRRKPAKDEESLSRAMASGARDLVTWRLRRLVVSRQVEKSGSGPHAKYRWIGNA